MTEPQLRLSNFPGDKKEHTPPACIHFIPTSIHLEAENFLPRSSYTPHTHTTCLPRKLQIRLIVLTPPSPPQT